MAYEKGFIFLMKKPTKQRTRKTEPAAPELSHEAEQWRNRILTEYPIEDAPGLLLLQQAAEALDELRQAQAAVREHGLIVKDRFGQPKPNPAALVVRDARTGLIRCLKALALDFNANAKP